MVAGFRFVTPHYKTLQGENRKKQDGEKEIKKLEREQIWEEERENNEVHMNGRGGRDRKAPMQREGVVQGERGRDKTEIPRGRKAGGMQMLAERKDYNGEELELHGL